MGSREGVLKGLHLLVVEDDDDAREILRLLLTYFGALVTPVSTLREGLSLLAAMEPSAVIADMMLGQDDALRLIREARKRGTRAPFIAVSGQDFDEAALQGAGFAAYLRKPLDHEKLVDTILA